MVRGATPEEQKLKAKKLSEKAHAESHATKQLQICKEEFRSNFTTKTQRTRRG
jgi:hypothetical protein